MLAVALVSTSPGGDEMTEFGLGATAGRVVGSFGPTVLTCTPSYALHVAEAAEEMGVSLAPLLVAVT